MTRYNHTAREAPREPGDGVRECFVCGAAVTGEGPTLKHFDEEVRLKPVPREYLPALHECVPAVEQALSFVTERANDAERARVAVVALIEAGYLRTRRTAPRR